MINNARVAVAQKLKELYPNYRVYADDVPQNFKTPAFVIYVIEQEYNKRLDNKYNGRISLDVAYFSDKPASEIKSDCLTTQETLLREFDTFGAFRAINKNAQITDNVSHVKFDIRFSGLKLDEFIPMQKQTTNTNI
jgi:hypothetical protein